MFTLGVMGCGSGAGSDDAHPPPGAESPLLLGSGPSATCGKREPYFPWPEGEHGQSLTVEIHNCTNNDTMTVVETVMIMGAFIVGDEGGGEA